jgi:hypothetical protein
VLEDQITVGMLPRIHRNEDGLDQYTPSGAILLERSVRELETLDLKQ